MKLSQIITLSEDSDKAPPEPGKLRDLWTTKQVADAAKVSESRIRQYKQEGKIKPIEGPVPGHQESMYTRAEVERFLKWHEKQKDNVGGRPPKGKEKKKD